MKTINHRWVTLLGYLIERMITMFKGILWRKILETPIIRVDVIVSC